MELTDTIVYGTPGEFGSYVIFTPKSITNYYVFCSNHGYGMGSLYNPIVVQSNLMNSKILTHRYKIDRDDPLKISNINNSFEKFYIEVINNYKYLPDSKFMFTYNNIDISTNLADSFLNNRLGSTNLLLESDTNIDSNILENYFFNLENTIDILSFTNASNVLNFNIDEDMTFEKNQFISYSILINSINYNISNDNISFSGNNTTLNLNSTILSLQSNNDHLQNLVNIIDSSNSQFTLIQKINQKLPLVDPSFNQTMFIELSEKYLFQDENLTQNFSVQLLDLSGNETGNYIYKFEYLLDITLLNDSTVRYFYNTKNNLDGDITREIKFLGIYQNFFYFSSVDNLSLTYSDSFKFYNTNYSLSTDKNGTQIMFVTNSYVKGTIIDVSNTQLINVACEKNDLLSLLNFPRYSLYLNNIFNQLKLKTMSKISYQFPLELDYSRFNSVTRREVNSTETINWNRNMIYKFFKSVKFFINDQLIDSHDPDTMKITDDLYLGGNIEKNPKLVDSKYQLFIPILFWFNLDSFNYLPLISMDQSTLTIKIDVNKVSELITNSTENMITSLPQSFNLTLVTDNIILDDIERRKFAEYNHEYIIERNMIYADKFSLKHNNRSSSTNIHLQLKGLIKDIILLFRSQETDNHYITKTTEDYERDMVNQEYYDLKLLYTQFINNNRHFNNRINSSYLSLFLLIESNLEKISSNSNVVNLIREDEELSKFDIELSMYLYFGKLKYIDDAININDGIKHYTKFTKIKYYYNKIYKNENISININPIKKIQFNANGVELFHSQNSNYYNYVVPHNKFAGTPDDGVYPYSFSLHPTERQPSGHLNFNVIQDSSIDVDFDEHTQNENIKLKTIVKEYQILRIISGIASLAWL